MVPIRPEDFDYVFDRGQLKAVRDGLSISQARMAELLDIPVNTLSRWETGVNYPDARALAAIYSLARGKGMNVQFFLARTERTIQNYRTELGMGWDFQNESLRSNQIEGEWEAMLEYLNMLFPNTKATRMLRAYTNPLQYEANQTLRSLGFQVTELFVDADPFLINDSRQYSQTNPEGRIFVLVSKDGGYSRLVRELSQSGVETFIWASEDCSDTLRNTVDDEHFIPWDRPYVVTQCVDVIRDLNGKPVSRARFGSLCHDVLEEDGCFPDDVGFSRRNPYGSLLKWLERQGIIKIIETDSKKDLIKISLLRS